MRLACCTMFARGHDRSKHSPACSTSNSLNFLVLILKYAPFSSSSFFHVHIHRAGFKKDGNFWSFPMGSPVESQLPSISPQVQRVPGSGGTTSIQDPSVLPALGPLESEPLQVQLTPHEASEKDGSTLSVLNLDMHSFTSSQNSEEMSYDLFSSPFTV